MSESVDYVKVIFGLVGGLAIFIYGMNLMGSGLQKVAGEKMRRIIEVLTSNPFMGVIVGALVTMILQSSSATTVMVVGFVSARLMTLPQAIGVIMGANIGTTITAQLVAFKVGHYAYPITAFGFIFFFFFKNKMLKYFGQTIFSFGLLFVGLNTMSEVMKPLAKSPVFEKMILNLSSNPLYGIIAGTLMTVIIQSSSATIAVLQNLASQPTESGSALINLKSAMPILFGDNIGTTITAILASIGASVNAKRAALAHSIFNIVGASIFVWFIPLFAKFVAYISPKGNEVEIIARQIANAHSTFNILNALIWIPFVWILARIVTFVIKGKDEAEDKTVLYIDNKVLNTAAVAMELTIKELVRMGQIAQKMMVSTKNSFINNDMDEVRKVEGMEETLDILQLEIVNYLSTLLSTSTLTDRQSIRLAGLMHVTHDIERIGDHCKNISEFAELKKDEKLVFSDTAISEITNAFEKVSTMVDDTINALSQGNITFAKKVLSEENEIDNLESKLRSSHLERLNSGLCSPHSAITFVELIHNLERIADNCNNIAEAVMDDYQKTPDSVKD